MIFRLHSKDTVKSMKYLQTCYEIYKWITGKKRRENLQKSDSIYNEDNEKNGNSVNFLEAFKSLFNTGELLTVILHESKYELIVIAIIDIIMYTGRDVYRLLIKLYDNAFLYKFTYDKDSCDVFMKVKLKQKRQHFSSQSMGSPIA